MEQKEYREEVRLRVARVHDHPLRPAVGVEKARGDSLMPLLEGDERPQ